MRRTGIIQASGFISQHVLHQAKDKDHLIGLEEERVTYDLKQRVANCIDDGRKYIVQVYPVNMDSSPHDFHVFELTRRAVVYLFDANDAEIDEMCHIPFEVTGNWVEIVSPGGTQPRLFKRAGEYWIRIS